MVSHHTEFDSDHNNYCNVFTKLEQGTYDNYCSLNHLFEAKGQLTVADSNGQYVPFWMLEIRNCKEKQV